MLVHSVYFWLKDNLSDADRARFHAGLEGLAKVDAVRALYVGTPAATARRPVIDDSYTFALTVIFDDLAGQDAYQADPIHQDFVRTFSATWTRIVIYDAD
ncbi:MAG: Dabb family protein [Planctomycetes bacterium]|nr:Dabb family protein [Planctomycetota bacterium]